MGSNYRLETIKAEFLAGFFLQATCEASQERQGKHGFVAGTAAAQG
jgi:hypothetical protein